MSSRVTRSSAKNTAEQSILNQDPLHTHSSNIERPSRKRKASAVDSLSDPHDQDVASESSAKRVRRSRRAKSSLESEEPIAAEPKSRKTSSKSKKTMSASRTPSEPPDENTSTSNPETSTSSRRRSAKTKKSSSDTADAASSSGSKRPKASTSKDRKRSSRRGAEEPHDSSDQPRKRDSGEDELESNDEEPSTNPGNGGDDGVGEDPFEAGFFGRRGAASSSISNTLRALSGMMSGTTGRLRRLLENLRQKDEPSVQLIALQELSELLLVSTEDNLAGHFAPDQFVKELVSLMEPNEFGEENPEMMLLACRCIANLMEALPQATGTVVYGGAVPVLLSKLLEIHYMDLAEQALTTLEKISVEFPASILRFGGLTACLTYLDFFATSTQRTAVTIAANCCRSIPEDSFAVVKDVMPILLNVLNSNDQRVIEQGCLCVSRIVESFKYYEGKLEELMSTDLLRVVLRLLLPGSTSLIGPGIHTQFLRVLSFTARASPSLTVELFKMNIVDTLYQILTGVSPPSSSDNAAHKIDSVVIMQALIHRPKEQVFETLNVICELLPGLDKNGMGFIDEMISHIRTSAGFDNLQESKSSSMQKRIDLLSNCKDELRRFAVILFPTLTDAYSSTVNLNVRQKVLTAQLKMLSNLDTDILEDALRAVPYASYLASILSQQDHPFLVTAGLQAAELLLERMDRIYRYQFYREGVIAEIQKLADRPLVNTTAATTSSVPEPTQAETMSTGTDPDELISDAPQHIENLTIPTDTQDEEGQSEGEPQEVEEIDEEAEDDVSEASSSSSDQHAASTPIANVQDAVTRFAQRFISQFENDSGKELRLKSSKILKELQILVSDIADCYDGGDAATGAKLFHDLARYFEGDALESITSYELLTSKVVSTLLDILQSTDGNSGEEAKSAFVQAFMCNTLQTSIKTSSSNSPVTPFSVLIYKLQDLLSRAEHFEVVTVHQNSFDSNRSSAASMLAKQIRIKLVADEDSGIPRPYRNIMVSIHAIATFKALDDYLRPRISLSDRPRASRNEESNSRALSGYAAALASLGQTDSQGQAQAQAQASLTTPPTGSGSGRATRGGMRSSQSAHPDGPTSPSERHAGRRSTRKSGALSASQTTNAPMQQSSPDQESSQDVLECADETKLEDDESDLEDESNLNAFMEAMGELEEQLDDEGSDPSAVNMEVAPTGSVTARQEDGTRIATPTQSTNGRAPAAAPNYAEMARNLLSTLPSRHMSYAAALQAVPQDWHLEFSANGQPISNETTIYRAVHFNQTGTPDVSGRNVWSAVHSVNFKRVPGPPSPEPNALISPSEVESDIGIGAAMPPSLENNPTTADILRLLRILHEINSNPDELFTDSAYTNKLNTEPLSQFVNTKLTAKLNRQLEEPLIVASNCLPGWSEDLARLYPFLFPFETRHLFLQSTSFGYSRSMARWQNAQSANDSRRDRHRDERPFLGRLQRQKVRISRNKILESAVKVMELYGASPSVLEVEYFEEVGTGLGPTLEFYSTVSKEFSKKKLRLWRDNESNRDDEFAFGKRGLFPAPMSEEQSITENGQKVLLLFKMLGKFVARSMLDSRIVDVSFNPAFFRISDNAQGTLPTLGAVKLVDEDLAKSLQVLKQFVQAKKKIDIQPRLTPIQKAQKLSRIQVAGATVEDLSLDFTLPGYPSIELIPGGADKPVTIENVGVYIEKVIDFTMSKGVHKQVDAFRAGFSQVFPYPTLKAFTPDELVMLFGRVDEDWSMETLMDSIKADHGYNLDSKSVRNLLQFMTELSPSARRDFLQFVSGSPKLPIGGFKSLTPMFTVVCKPSEPPLSSDDYLPSVMTCVNYLKLPDYSNLDVMRQKLNMAIKEGQGAFHLS